MTLQNNRPASTHHLAVRAAKEQGQASKELAGIACLYS
jgi:hypothetical protein